MTTTMHPPTNTRKASPSNSAAINQIHLDLDQLVNRLRRQIWTCATLAAGTMVIVSLLAMLVIDAVFQPDLTGLRILLWLPLAAVVAMVIRRLLLVPLKQECDRLAMAWTLEQKRPTIEERLTTSLQLTATPHGKTSSLVEAVAQQAQGSLVGCKDEDLREQEVLRRAIIAGACFTAFVLSLWIWAPYLIPSLQNVLNPWNSRALPHLNAIIVPGNTHVAEGGELRVTATANRLEDAVLEVVENEAVISSHQMATDANHRTAEFTLTNLTSDLHYRVRSGGLYSDRYQIFVDRKPVIMSCQVNLAFPEYTQRPVQIINDPVESIEVIHGTRIRIDVDVQSNLPPAESSLSFDGTTTPCSDVVAIDETGFWRHRWELTATARDLQRGTITLVSEAGVPSDPFEFEISILPDLPPTIMIDQPALSEVTAAPDQNIDITYHAVDDFGCSQLHLNTQKNDEPPSTKELQHPVLAEFTGELTVNLSELEVGSADHVTIWLSITDSRPDQYGGPQVADSRKIRVQIADEAIPVGQQVVRNEEQAFSADLTQAIQHLQQAAEFASDLQTEPGADADAAKTPDDIVEKSRQLQDQIRNAEQALSRLTAPDEPSSQRLFQPEIERIQEVTEHEVAEAKNQAGLVPLADDRPQQQAAIAATKESLKEAIEKLENVREDMDQRGWQLELAAQLDELARKQEQLAQQLDQGRSDAPNVQEEQQQVADALQDVVEQDLDAKSEQFAQRAEKAAELSEMAAELQQQQQALADIDRARTKSELDDQLLDMIAKEQDQITKQAQSLEQQAADLQPPAANALEANALEQTPEAANEPNDADQTAKPNAVAEARKQMEAIREKLKQKDLEQAEADAQQAVERLQEQAESVPGNTAAQPDANNDDQVRQTEDDLQELAKQQERVAEAIKAVREDRPEEAAAKLQEQVAERTRRLRDKADELLQLPTEDPQNQQAVQEAREKLEQAEKETRAAEERTTPQPQEASVPKQAGEQQQQAGEPKQAGEQQQQAGEPKQAGEKQKQAGEPKQAGEQQKQAAKSLQEATQSLEKVCQSCKKCSNCNKAGSSSASVGSSPKGTGKQSQPSDSKQGDSKQGDSQQGDSQQGDSQQGDSKQKGQSGEAGNESSKPQQQPASKQLAATADQAHKAARTPTRKQTQELAKGLNQLADAAAQQAGYPNRNPGSKNSESKDGSSKPSQSSDSSQQAGAPRPGKSSEPQGVQGNAGANHSDVAPTQLRGRSTSNWTQSRRKLKGNVLDDPNSRIPEEYRGVVKDYFEELSRLESRQDTSEEQK